jgi:hypothetical protein
VQNRCEGVLRSWSYIRFASISIFSANMSARSAKRPKTQLMKALRPALEERAYAEHASPEAIGKEVETPLVLLSQFRFWTLLDSA